MSRAEPDFAKSIADVIAEESAAGGAAGWRSCTGCHETDEGYETGHFPYSEMFGCYVGSGCSECGGIGVTWEYWSESDLEAMARDHEPAAPEGQQEPAAWTQPACLATIADGGSGEIWAKRNCDEIRDFIDQPDMPDDVPLYTTPPASAIREALEKLLTVAEKQKAYHNTKQHEFPSIEQCTDENGILNPSQNLYALLQGEAYNGRYTEADWWICTIREEIAALAGAKP